LSIRRTVHIPIVQPGKAGDELARSEDRLIEVYTQLGTLEVLTRREEEAWRELDAKARDKDWDRVAAPLRKVGLYQAGCAAASAVRKLGIRRPPTALYQRISRLAWIEGQRLHPAGAQGPTEGRSAELGLALVLLMCASGSRDRHIIATGALEGQPAGVTEPDVEVKPVGSLPEKLRLVLALARHGALPGTEKGRELLFFTPCRFQDNEGSWRDVAELAEVAELQACSVRVVPVARLGEAAAVLKAHRTRHLPGDRVAASVLIALLLATGLGMAWQNLQETHVPMAFMPAGGDARVPQPFLACFTPDGGFYPVALGRDGIGYTVPGGATLAWRVRIGQPVEERQGLAAWFAPEAYYVAQVMVSEHSRAKVIVPRLGGADPVQVPPGGIWEWGWKLNDHSEQAETNGLVLLAQGGRPFDPEVLRTRLLERFPAAAGDGGDGPGLDVSAAADFVAAQAPGAVKFIVQTVEDSERCSL
jgi:hypothetical protein